MCDTTSIAVRVGPETKDRIKKLARARPDGIVATTSQVVRAALEIGLSQMEQVTKEGNSHG